MVKSNIVIGSIGIVISIFVWLYSEVTFPEERNVQIGSAFFPRMLAVGFAILCIVLILQGVFSKVKSHGIKMSIKDPKVWRVLITLGGSIIFAFLIKRIGFMICGIMLMTGLMFMLGLRKLTVMVPVAVGTVLAVQFVFQYLLGIILPYGLLEFVQYL